MAPYTRQSRRTGGRNKSDTALSRRAHLMSSRAYNPKEKSPFTASKIDGSVIGFKSVEQPKTILRIRLRKSALGPSVSLVTSSVNPYSSSRPGKKIKSKGGSLESCTDRLIWLQRLRPTPHRQAKLLESQI
ncbi:hypothetical protein N7481_001306 [Penicillium waksmanii]|uniref:uncharacterized protein n=1 Tax=Penicillium waksmanii TaxID=69791 RepID=UPI00254843AA|nr:uncharacterized protein N7481_001306 [Penicillium waksmanii]KAJ6000897.1 hypothetical protein N7481_001306 [Penicillium waksmanii]